MREIKFRGKRIKDGKWVEGFYSQFHNRPVIPEPNIHQIFELLSDENSIILAGTAIGGIWHTIDPNTLCEFTGLYDKNGKEIYEGDIVAPKYITPVGKLTEDLDYDRKGVIELVAGSYVIKRPNHNHMALYSLVELEDMGYISNVGNVYIPKNNICFVEVIGDIHDNPELLD